MTGPARLGTHHRPANEAKALVEVCDHLDARILVQHGGHLRARAKALLAHRRIAAWELLNPAGNQS
jgi:hypothetical protein